MDTRALARRLTANRKERFRGSGVGTELVAKLLPRD